MFGNVSLPSCIYSYDVISKKGIGINALKFCEDSLWHCNQYRNALIEDRRKQLELIGEKRFLLFPDYEKQQGMIREIDSKIAAVYDAIKQANVEAGVRATGTTDQKATIRRLKTEKKALLESHKAAKTAIAQDENFKSFLADINEEANQKKKEIYAQFGDRLFWSFRLGIDKTMPSLKQFPKFRRYDGSGRLYFQFQNPKARNNPLTWERVISGKDNRIKVREEEVRVPLFSGGKRCGETSRRHMVAILYAGKTYVEVPFHMHRPLPPGVLIKECFLVRERVGTSAKWKIQFVVSSAEGFAKADRTQSHDECAIDVNWTKCDNGLLVVALYGVSSNKEEHLKLYIDEHKVNYYKKVRDLQSICKNNFNKARDNLKVWIDRAEWDNSPIPEWLVEKTKYLDKWQSARKLWSLVKHWSNNRFTGDDDIMCDLSHWMEREAHLYNWQVCQSKKFLAWRDHLYRNFFAKLRRKYSTIFIESLNLAEMKRRPDPTKDAKEATRVYRDMVSPGRLLAIAKETMTCKEVSAVNSSKQCHKCHHINDLGSQQVYTCEKCGVQWDRHENAAINLYNRGRSQDDV